MESLFTMFLLFLAAITALLSYALIPSVPVTALMSAAAVGLAAGVWWHWTQFSVDYRTSTWQEQLRSYASYVMVLLVIVLSYGFYAFTAGGGSVPAIIEDTTSAIQNATSRGLTAASNILTTNTAGSEEAPAGFNSLRPNSNRRRSNANANRNLVNTSGGANFLI